MFAIFKRELRSYFTSLVGYVVIGVMLAFIGLYYSANCLVYGTSDFSTVLYSTTLVMLFLLPALTMRSFADERRNKTDQLLLTSPVGIPSIVMGKYFAQLAVFAVPMAAAAIMPLVLTAFGTISLTSAYATWLAYFLMGAACIAIGTFVSALTENQIIAYLATFGALLICYLMNGHQEPVHQRQHAGIHRVLRGAGGCGSAGRSGLQKLSRWAARCSAAVPWCWCCCLSCARPGC